VKGIAGIYPYDEGEVFFDGEKVTINNPRDSAALDIEIVYQDLAVMWNSKLVILDEPTAALGVAQTRQVLDLVKTLSKQGLAVILISHNLHDIFEVADRIAVLRLGQKVAEFATEDVTQQDVVHAITAGTMQHVPGMAEA